MQLENKRIIVTGGARGMGASAVRTFAAEGAHVASLDIIDDPGREVTVEANQKGSGFVTYYH